MQSGLRDKSTLTRDSRSGRRYRHVRLSVGNDSALELRGCGAVRLAAEGALDQSLGLIVPNHLRTAH